MAQQITHNLNSLAGHSPVTHGYPAIELICENEVVTSAKPLLGSMHRGAEKLFESRDYRQILMLANRHEWLGSFAGELGVAQLVENALGIEVPEGAQWFRTLLLEYGRVNSHLAFIAGFPWLDSNIENDFRKIRENWVKHIANYTGNRMHPMLTRIGGISHSPTASWIEELKFLINATNDLIKTQLPNVNSHLANFAGLGKLSKEDVIEFGLSGPVARASGYQIDIRKNASGLKFAELNFDEIQSSSGDVTGRIKILIDEVSQSLKLLTELIDVCKNKLDEPIDVLLPKVLRVPEGVYEHQIETPLGIASWLLISKNDKMPYRLKLRPASLHTYLALEKVLIGISLDQVDAVVASMPFISGDTDR